MTDETRRDVEELARRDGALDVVRAHKLAEAERRMLKADTSGSEVMIVAVGAMALEQCGVPEGRLPIAVVAVAAIAAMTALRFVREVRARRPSG